MRLFHQTHLGRKTGQVATGQSDIEFLCPVRPAHEKSHQCTRYVSSIPLLIVDGSYSSGGSPPEPLSPETFRDYVPQPSYFQDHSEFHQGRNYRTPSFDCSIQQLLSPVPYTPHLPMMTSSVDPMLLAQPLFESQSSEADIKMEEDDGHKAFRVEEKHGWNSPAPAPAAGVVFIGSAASTRCVQLLAARAARRGHTAVAR